MSITVTFYNFSKKKNSTKIPDVSGTSYDVILKEECSITDPVILLNGGNKANWNFCYIPSFNRYYFIKDWITTYDMWEAHLTVDVLASFRNIINNSTQYVLRSASKKDTFIVNNAYVSTKECEYHHDDILSFPSAFPFGSANSYVLAIANNSTLGKVNGLQYVVCTQSQMTNLLNNILNDNNSYGWGSSEASYGLTSAVARAIVNPLQYIGECYMLPFSIASGNLVSLSGVKVGYWLLDSGTYNAVVPNFPGAPVFSTEHNITLPIHPESNTIGRWLEGYPYSRYTLYAGIFGVINLDNSLFIGKRTTSSNQIQLKLKVECDFLGKARLEVWNDYTDESGSHSILVAKAYADVSVPIALSQTKNDILSFIGNMGGAVNGIVSSGGSSTISATARLSESIDSIFPKPEVKGFNQSALQIFEQWSIDSEFMIMSSRDQVNTNLLGDPLCEVINLNQLSGYCQCDDPALPINAYYSETEQILDYMKGGFFIE